MKNSQSSFSEPITDPAYAFSSGHDVCRSLPKKQEYSGLKSPCKLVGAVFSPQAATSASCILGLGALSCALLHALASARLRRGAIFCCSPWERGVQEQLCCVPTSCCAPTNLPVSTARRGSARARCASWLFPRQDPQGVLCSIRRAIDLPRGEERSGSSSRQGLLG